jgi:hypothetical protein
LVIAGAVQTDVTVERTDLTSVFQKSGLPQGAPSEFAEKLDTEGGGGFNPRIKPI